MKDTLFYSVVLVFDKKKTKLLLGKRREDGLWTSPAGGGHLNESPKDCAVRELFEEANIRCTHAELNYLTTTMAGNKRPVFIYTLKLVGSQDLHVKNDPDKEVPSWRWFLLDKLPPLEPHKMETINMAKMKVLLKSIVSTDRFTGTDLNTQDFSQDEIAAKNTYWYDVLSEKLNKDPESDIIPEIELERGFILDARRLSEGFYSGSVKDSTTGERILDFAELTVPSLVQALKAKEFIGHNEAYAKQDVVVDKLDELVDKLKPESPPEGDSDVEVFAPGIGDLKSILSTLKNVHIEGDLNINIKKSVLKAQLEELSKGKAFPIGTKRTYSNGITVVKHSSGEWIQVGGPHHGKLYGESSKEALPEHKELADKHVNVEDPEGVKNGTKDDDVDTKEPNAKTDQGAKENESEDAKKRKNGDEVEGPKSSEGAGEGVPEGSSTQGGPSDDPGDSPVGEPVGDNKKPQVAEEAGESPSQGLTSDQERARKDNPSLYAQTKDLHSEMVDKTNNEYVAWRKVQYKKTLLERYPNHPESAIDKAVIRHRVAADAKGIYDRVAHAAQVFGLKPLKDSVSEASKRASKTQGALAEGEDLVKSELNSKTNMIKSVDFSKTSKAKRVKLLRHLEDSNKIINHMGIKFKEPLQFSCTKLGTGTKNVRARYVVRGSNRMVILQDISAANKSVMHEIGHGVDHAMGDSEKFRSSEAHSIEGTLSKDYQELLALITNSELYKDAEGDSKRSSYLNEPTEVFARAFEVHSLVKAEELIAKGEVSKDFLEAFVPEVFTSKDKNLMKLQSTVEDSYKDYIKAKKEGPPESVIKVKAVYEAARDDFNSKVKVSGSRITMPKSEQDAYKKKISTLMDRILKTDEVRKALELLGLSRA